MGKIIVDKVLRPDDGQDGKRADAAQAHFRRMYAGLYSVRVHKTYPDGVTVYRATLYGPDGPVKFVEITENGRVI